MYVMKTDGERIEVDVVWKESSYPLSIRDAMFYLGYGASEGYINSEVVRIQLFSNMQFTAKMVST